MTATIDSAAAEVLLMEERARVVRQLKDLGADESGALTGSVDYGDAFADAGAVTAERTEVLGLVETHKDRLDRIDKALGKISEGTYGICEACGNEIEPDRIEYLPAARRCVGCKAAS
jgi:RNA polymerase-binding transcription factor DksA